MSEDHKDINKTLKSLIESNSTDKYKNTPITGKIEIDGEEVTLSDNRK